MTTVDPGTSPDVFARFQAGRLVGDWTLDPGRSQARLSTRSMWGMAPVKGAFTGLSGSATVSEEGKVSGTLTVDAGSLDTKSRTRDKHLRSADFLDVANHPSITFVVTRVEGSAAGVTAFGSLQVRGVTRPAAVPVQASMLAGGQVQLAGTVTIDRTEFGLSWNQLGMASMKNKITITAVFTRR
jgi:polyisoprenoid-binding protein YceI